MKTISCRDIAPEINCSFQAKGRIEDEVIDMMMDHAENAHPEKIRQLEQMLKRGVKEIMRSWMEEE